MKTKIKSVYCPDCLKQIWDLAFASKLNKCWHCGLAFDEGLTRTEGGEGETLATGGK